MTINWYGEGCFKIAAKDLSIIIDPPEKESGLKAPRSKADILILSRLGALDPDNENKRAQPEQGYTVYGPGEYEIKEVQITGWPLKKEGDKKFLGSVFRIKVEDISLGFLGAMQNFSDPEIIEEMGDLDILFIPAGNADLIDSKTAAKIVRQIEPRMLIPTHFKVKGLKRKADPVEGFLKEIGATVSPQEKLSVKRKDLSEKMQVVLLSN